MINYFKTSITKNSCMRVCRLPENPIISKIVKVPQSLPLEFYNQCWLYKLPINQQQSFPNSKQVAFLSDPQNSLFPNKNPCYNPRLYYKKYSWCTNLKTMRTKKMKNSKKVRSILKQPINFFHKYIFYDKRNHIHK